MKKYRGQQYQFDKLKGFQKIPCASEAYSKARYQLELHLGTFEIETFNIWKIENIHMKELYEDYCKKDHVSRVNCVMLAQQLGETNNIVSLQERGFLMPNSGGAVFPCGFVPSNLNSSFIEYAVMFEAAISSAVSIPVEKITPAQRVDTEKKGIYDAIRIVSDVHNRQTSHPFEENVVLFKNEQLLPLYVIEVSYSLNTKGMCQSCKNRKATVFCINDGQDLCDDCDAKMHLREGSSNSYHQRVLVQQKPVIYKKCENHPNQDVVLICSDCQEHLCITCKLSGSHSQPPLNSHQLASIQDCYDFLKQNKSRKSIQMKNLSSRFRDSLNYLKEKSAEMEKTFLEMEIKLQAFYDRAVIELSEIREEGLREISSMILMLEQKLKELDWMEYFIKFQIDYQDPGEYIDKYFTHQKLHKDLFNAAAFPDKLIFQKHSNYFLDIKCEFINLSAELAKKEKEEKELMIEMEAQKLFEEREKERKEKELERLKSIELTGIEREKELAEQRKIARLDRLSKINELKLLEEEANRPREIEPSTSRIVKKLSREAQQIRKSLETKFDIFKVGSMLDEAFDESEILTGSEKAIVYLNCVQDDENLPFTYLTEDFDSDDPPNCFMLEELLQDITQPSLFVFQYQGCIFGGYANADWNSNTLDSEMREVKGKNFLFSIDKDHKIRINKHQKDIIYQWKSNDGLGWGATDLVIDQDGNWKSHLESSYTTNMDITDEEAKVYLCGKNVFIPDKLEIWTLDYNI